MTLLCSDTRSHVNLCLAQQTKVTRLQATLLFTGELTWQPAVTQTTEANPFETLVHTIS